MEPNNPSDTERSELDRPIEKPTVIQPSVPVPVAATGGEGVAEQYVADQLHNARLSLQRTQLIGALLVLVTLLYMLYMAINFRRYLEPQAAAEVAGGLISERVNEQAQGVADQVKARVPEMIRELPDYALAQMPIYREALEQRIATDLRTHSAAAALNLGDHLDVFLDEHKDKIKTVFEATADSQAVKQMGAEIEHEFLKSLKNTQAGGGETLKTKLDTSLQMLQQVNMKMSRLANAKNLTPQERKARRAIAIMTTKLDHEIQQNGLQNLKLNEVTDPMGDSLGSALSAASNSVAAHAASGNKSGDDAPAGASASGTRP